MGGRLLIAARNPDAFAKLFRAELPGHDILTAFPEDGGPVAYAVVGRPEPGLLARLTGLELVLSLNAGIEHLLASGEVPASVPIVRMVDDGLREGMVEWVAAQVLAWHRNLFAYRDSHGDGIWAPSREALARDRVVTVLGAGALGGPVAAMLAALGFRTRAWSRAPRALAGIEGFAGPEALGSAVIGADVVVNLLPLTPATTDLIDRALLARMRPGGLLVNAGRGASLVDADLLAALDDGTLGAAVLDVFRQEPLPADHPFWRHPRLIVSPHVAAPTHVETAVEAMAESVRRHEAGQPVPHMVDPQAGY